MPISLAPERRASRSIRAVSPPRLTARAMAHLYTEYLSALWRGDDVSAITTWLEARWNHQGPHQPEDTPDAVSLLGGAAVGENRISWYQHDDAILGYQSGQRHGAYRIPTSETPPPLCR